MSDSESNCRVKRQKRMANKRSKVTTPKGSNPNQAGVVILLTFLFKITSCYCKKKFIVKLKKNTARMLIFFFQNFNLN